MGTSFIRNNIVVGGTEPIDINGSGSSSDTVNLKNADHVTYILFVGALTVGTIVTLKQATDVAGTGLKALAFSKYFTKQNFGTVSDWTETTCSSTFTTTTQNDSLYVVEIDASSLDVTNGFDCMQAALSDPGASCLISSVFILSKPRYATKPMPSGIV